MQGVFDSFTSRVGLDLREPAFIIKHTVIYKNGMGNLCSFSLDCLLDPQKKLEKGKF